MNNGWQIPENPADNAADNPEITDIGIFDVTFLMSGNSGKKNNSYRVLLNRQTQNVIPDKDGSARTTYIPIMRVSKSPPGYLA